MHRKSGLIADLKGDDVVTLAQAEADIINLFKTKSTFDKREFMIAGSGVATFDFPLIKTHMPELASWFAYFPADIGIFRRLSKAYGHGRDFYNPVIASFGESKEHRAWGDVLAHVEEAKRQRSVVQEVFTYRDGGGIKAKEPYVDNTPY